MIQWLVLMIMMMIMQWLALAPHSRNVLGSGPGSHCVESVFCWCLCGFFSRFSSHSFHPQSNGEQIWVSVHVRVCVCVCVCVRVYGDGSVVIWRLQDHHWHLSDEDNTLLKQNKQMIFRVCLDYCLCFYCTNQPLWDLVAMTMLKEKPTHHSIHPSVQTSIATSSSSSRGVPVAFPGLPTKKKNRSNFQKITLP